MYSVIVVGSGYAGSIMARKYAEQGKKVLLMENRGHIAGNMYDSLDENGILVHKYGPHIAYMDHQRTFDFLSEFSEFVPYEHCVNADIDGIEVPLPFNLTSIDRLFDAEQAEELKTLLIDSYGMEKKIPILTLRQSENQKIRILAELIYEKIFIDYTTKMWDLTPEEVDPSVTARIPVHISYDNRHFTCPIQVMPKHGYTKLFEAMLSHPNITVKLNTNALDVISLKDDEIYYEGQKWDGTLVYTGAIDTFFGYRFGELQYRSLYFEYETHPVDRLQDSTVLNWPDKRAATRRTENKLLVCQPNVPGVTSTIVEYPGKYDKNDKKWNVPYYPIPSPKNHEQYEQYNKEAMKIKNLVMIGRLAEYRYYNMEGIITAALDKFEAICK